MEFVVSPNRGYVIFSRSYIFSGMSLFATVTYRIIVPLKGHCIATWYAVFRYLVKLTELETSWGRGDTVTY